MSFSFFQSTDAVHLHHLKRSYPELREAVSENGMLDSMYETSTNVSTVVALQSNVSSMANGTTIRKGILWQQRDKIFSRWKERFFILTPDYLQCYKKSASRISEMGGFIFKLRLSEVSKYETHKNDRELCNKSLFMQPGRVYLCKMKTEYGGD